MSGDIDVRRGVETMLGAPIDVEARGRVVGSLDGYGDEVDEWADRAQGLRRAEAVHDKLRATAVRVR